MSVMDSIDRALDVLEARGARASADELKEVRAVVQKMAMALVSTSMLRQLGGMMHGSREVMLIACDTAESALADFRGEP